MDTEVITQSRSIGYYMFLVIKRLFDLICAVIGLIILIPLILIIKLLYICNKDFDSIFYTQERIGLNGKIFKLYKFRTMVPNADTMLKDILKDPIRRREYNLNKKLHDDPRVTRVGRFLRKSSLDEMPQMINVFKGEMSIIGNRPYLPSEKKDMGRYYDKIIETKPGITGLWQTSGRSDVTFAKRCEIEEKYSNTYSIRLDTKIFLKTFKELYDRSGK